MFARGLLLSLVSLPLLLGAQGGPGAKAQKEISRELAGFLGQHFADQSLEHAEFRRRHGERERRVLEIVQAGALASLEDWDNAAVILQYSDDVETILLAHVLAVRPAVADESQARTLVAFALDHYLGNLDKAMPFGTQSPNPTPRDVLSVDAGGQPLPERIRKEFRQNPLQGRVRSKVRKPGGKELQELVAATPETVAAALPRVRELVASGHLQSAEDLADAARLLLRSSDEKDLLVAHIVALCAAFEEHPAGLTLVLESLDRYLLATQRGQIFGTVKDASGALVEPIALAPEVVLRGYGLLAAAPDRK